MKKMVMVIMVCLLICFFGGDCVRYFQQQEESSIDGVQNIDIHNKNIVESNINVSADFENELSIDEFKNESSDIIKANIIKIDYISYGSVPWSVLTAKVNDTIKGSCKVGQTIKVYEMGGYIKYSDFKQEYWELPDAQKDSDLVKIRYFQSKLHEKGEESIFFLNSDITNLPFANIGYQLVGDSFSIMTLDKRSNKYIEKRNEWNLQENEYEYEEIKEMIEE